MATPTPYQLDPEQTLRASKALLEHIRSETKRIQQNSTKKELLNSTDDSDSDDNTAGDDETPVWLTISTKQHVVDRNRLKPSTVSVPHSLHPSPNLSICLITADPQRAVKNAVADPTFPTSLSSRINKIIGFTKMKARYKTFESKRELLSEHDIFLADDRIINRLPDALGKVFYKGSSKRPIAVNIAAQDKVDGKRVKPPPGVRKSKEDKVASFTTPAKIAKEIEKAVGSVPVSLKPGTLVAVRAGLASFTPQQLKDNVDTLVNKIIEKHVVRGWRNVKGIYVKSPTSMAIPVWLADEMWAEETNVEVAEEVEALEGQKSSLKRKRKPVTKKGPQVGQRKRTRLEEADPEDQELESGRKTKLASLKAQTFKTGLVAAH